MTRPDIQESFRSFISRLQPGASVHILAHSDADGLTAGAILARAFAMRGFRPTAEVTRKGESGWGSATAERITAAHPDALVMADLGSRADAVLERVLLLVVDHHRPTGAPPDAVLISGYGEEPTPTSGVLAYWCAEAIGAAAGLNWLAAISVLADLGPGIRFEGIGPAPKREVTTLLNAPRRTTKGDAQPALELLLESSGPDEMLRDPRVVYLRECKAEFDAALAQARRAAPKFSGELALIGIDTPCQVHPIIAQTWRNRLPKYIVMCANRGYLPERVNFAMRTKLAVNLLDFLREHRPQNVGDEFGRGHDQATGGSLTFAAWEEFSRSLGFS